MAETVVPARVIELFVSAVKEALIKEDGNELGRLLFVDGGQFLNSEFLYALRESTRDGIEFACADLVPEWSGFADLVKENLFYLKDSVEFSSIKDKNKALLSVGTQLATAFTNPRAYWIVPVVKNLTTVIAATAVASDEGDAHLPAVNAASRLIFRMLNVTLGDRQPMPKTKRAAVLHIANLLFRLYFKLDQIRLCPMIHANLASSRLDLRQFSRAERVSYKYFLGRHFLFQNKFDKACQHLRYAFDNCLALSPNKR